MLPSTRSNQSKKGRICFIVICVERPKKPTAPKKKAKNQTAKERYDAFRDIVLLL
jgi:hypothetical protein